MPSLSNEPQLQKVTLNGYSADDPAIVELDTQPIYGEEADLIDKSADGLEAMRQIITARIKSWNLTIKDAESGNEISAPITIDTVRKLRQAAILQLGQLLEATIDGLDPTEKKSSSLTSQ